MNDMPAETHPARHRNGRQPVAAWLLYLTMGGTQVSYNLYHSFHSFHSPHHHSELPWLLAVLFGAIPVVASWIASHLAARRSADGWIQAAAYAVTLLAMALSIGATATVVARGPGLWDAIGFGALLDIASLLALRVILRHARVAAEAADANSRAEALMADAQKLALSARAEAEGLAAAAREEATETVRVERGRLARTEEELAGARAELERVRADLERAREAVLKGGPRGRSTGPRRGARTGPGTAARTGLSDNVDDLSIEARMLEVLATKPELKGKELAAELGVSDGYARKLRRRLTDPDRPQERSQDRDEDRDGPVVQDRPQERSEDQGRGAQ